MRITVIGGGTGTTTVLEGLKHHSDLDISVIVGMGDDGGSNAVVRDEFGLLPLSDIRKSIVALSSENENDILRKLFTYRFSHGNGLKGHTLGNLLMIAMTDIAGSEVESIEVMEYLFGVRGKILPVTLDRVKLVAKYTDGTKVVGEHFIDEPKEDKRIKDFYLEGVHKAFKPALKAILDAEYIIIGPGDLYTTILANIAIPEISEALRGTSAKLVFISNLMSKIGQTRGMTQSEILEVVERYIGRKIDYVLVNKGRLPQSAYDRYIADGEHIFKDDLNNGNGRVIIRRDLVANSSVKKDSGDSLARSLVRHDSEKVSNELYGIFRKGWRSALHTLLSFYR